MFGALSQRIRNARKNRINKRHFPLPQVFYSSTRRVGEA